MSIAEQEPTALDAYYTDHFTLPLPAGHRFPMAKYSQLRQRVADAAARLGITLGEPLAASDEQLCLMHDSEYVRRVRDGLLSDDEQRRIGFPWSPAMVERSRRSAGATIAACRSALRDGVAVNLAGGTHHASRDRGQGYCVFNDSAVAAANLIRHGLARRVAIIDADVHQGNGTAALCRDDPSIFTFSIHGAKDFPSIKEPGDLDVALPPKTGDDAYLSALAPALRRVIEGFQPDIAIYLAGADPFWDDRNGTLALTHAGLAERDAMVLRACRSAGIPLAIAMAGGYARCIDDIVAIHFTTVQQAAELART